MKKFLILFIVGMLSIACVGCGNSGSTKDASTTESNSDSTKSNSDSESKKEYKVGDVISFEGQEITVTSVQRNYDSGNEYIKAKTGNEFVKVTVSVKNISNSKISVGPFEFKLQNSEGAQETTTGLTYTIDDKFDSAELVPGGTRTGSLVFEAPKDDAGLKLIYNPSLFGDKKLEIKL